jgi:hypothetical protein
MHSTLISLMGTLRCLLVISVLADVQQQGIKRSAGSGLRGAGDKRAGNGLTPTVYAALPEDSEHAVNSDNDTVS